MEQSRKNLIYPNFQDLGGKGGGATRSWAGAGGGESRDFDSNTWNQRVPKVVGGWHKGERFINIFSIELIIRSASDQPSFPDRTASASSLDTDQESAGSGGADVHIGLKLTLTLTLCPFSTEVSVSVGERLEHVVGSLSHLGEIESPSLPPIALLKTGNKLGLELRRRLDLDLPFQKLLFSRQDLRWYHFVFALVGLLVPITHLRS